MNENTAIVSKVDDGVIENVILNGDLAQLTPAQRISYYQAVCKSLGLNPLTQPFAYIKLGNKLVLYAKRDAADQLRKLHGISIDKPDVTFNDDLVIVAVTGRDQAGRTDSDLGVVSIGNLKGDQKANAILKAITKGKRRLTLSIVGLGWLDETEVETIPDAEIIDPSEPLSTAHPPQGNGGNGDNGKETPKSVSPEEYRALPVPATWTELWGQRRYAELGYRHKNHASKVLEKVFGDLKGVAVEAAWQVLVDHQLSKLAETEPAEAEPEPQEQEEMPF